MASCPKCHGNISDNGTACGNCGPSGPQEQASAPLTLENKNGAGRDGVMVLVILLVLFGLIGVAVAVNGGGARSASGGKTVTVPEEKPSDTSAPAPAILSPWSVSASKNELSGEAQLTVINGFRDHAIIVRKRGKKLDCYITTGEFLETVENMDSRRSAVRYKFDDGAIVRQEWIISDNNTSLFYPADPRTFLFKMSIAKRFIVEYRPSDKVPQTQSFDVSPFPPELLEILGPAGRGDRTPN
jgi:hypothetical protein